MNASERFFERHNIYLQTEAWARKREEAFKAYGRKCAACGGTSGVIQVDHLTYRRHGKEDVRDLLVLCGYHHRTITSARRALGLKPGMGYLRHAEEFLAIDLTARGDIDTGRTHGVRSLQVTPASGVGVPCASCGRPTNRKRPGSRCVPCRRKERGPRVSASRGKMTP